MTLREAIDSGKRFRRKAWNGFEDSGWMFASSDGFKGSKDCGVRGVCSTYLIYTLDDILADDYELEPVDAFPQWAWWTLKVNGTQTHLMRSIVKPDPTDFPASLLSGWHTEVVRVKLVEVDK